MQRIGARVLEAALSQLGVRELTGANDGVPAERYALGQEVPWCAFFVAWCYATAGAPLPGNRWKLGSVQYMEDQLRAAGAWAPAISTDGPVTTRYVPQPGELVFFGSRGDSDRGPGRHVGIVERVENGRVHTVEGNTSNRVARRSYPLGHARITGYGWHP